jgi:hypothetical protein
MLFNIALFFVEVDGNFRVYNKTLKMLGSLFFSRKRTRIFSRKCKKKMHFDALIEKKVYVQFQKRTNTLTIQLDPTRLA